MGQIRKKMAKKKQKNTAIIIHTVKHTYTGQTYLQHLHYRIFL